MSERPLWLKALTAPGDALAAGLRALPEAVGEFGVNGELKRAAPPVHVNWPDITINPQVMLLWNGVPLQELGIDTALVSVSFTTTVGRSKPTKKFAFGKPKVGGASIVFLLSDAQQSEVLAKLIHADSKPNISIAFGYELGKSYWAGSFAAAQVVDGKKFKKASSFKVDRISWDYNSSSIPKVTINGVSDKAIQLTTNVSPRVYTDANIRRIFEGVADENGLILDVDPDLPLDARMAQVIKGSNESDFDMLSNLASRMGASMYLIDGVGEYGATGVTNRFKVSGDPAAVVAADTSKLRDTVRGILRVSKLPGFMDLSKFDQARPLVIGYGAFMDAKARHDCDVLASSVSISDVRHAGGGGNATKIRATDPDSGVFRVAGALSPSDNSAFIALFAPGVQEVLDLDKRNTYLQSAEGQADVKNISPEKLAAILRANSNPGAPSQAHKAKPPKRPGVAAPSVGKDVEPTGKLSSAKLAALALRASFNFEVSITITPGIPFIQAPFQIELRGTRAHDGPYGVEEATTSWSGSGLTTTLKCKPFTIKPPGSGRKKNKQADGSDTLKLATESAGIVQLVDVVQGKQEFLSLEAREERERGAPKDNAVQRGPSK